MVGRLVEQQHVGVLRQRARDRRAAPLAAAGGRGRARQVDPELVGDRLHLVSAPARRGRQRRSRAASRSPHLRILLEQHDRGPGLDRPPALVGLDQPGEALEQRGLARAVAADQRQPVARADVEVEVAEQPAFALDQAQAFLSEDRCGHRPPLRRASSRPQCAWAAFCASTIAAISLSNWRASYTTPSLITYLIRRHDGSSHPAPVGRSRCRRASSGSAAGFPAR